MGKIQWSMLVVLLLLLPEVSCITLKNNNMYACHTEDYPDSGQMMKLIEMITRRYKADRYDYSRWNERPLLGKYNILPDDILNTALQGNELEIKAILKDKKLVRNPHNNEITGLYRSADKN